MRKLKASFSDFIENRVHRVISADLLSSEWVPDLRFLVSVSSEEEASLIDAMRDRGARNVGWIFGSNIQTGDVLIPRTSHGDATVLFRESDVHHSLLITNRCNSYCLMCSQPPTTPVDDWLIEEALDVIRHIGTSPGVLGLSGGEPLLQPIGLQQILNAIATQHPLTRVEVLTNGRLMSSPAVANELLALHPKHISWLVPLYGPADFLHDFVVQAPGAFEETIAGLLVLREFEQSVQLRTVLIEPVLRVLPELCGYIARNLPFVREVALMGCEPIGFALANREACEVDLTEWADTLRTSALELHRRHVPFVFMNTPLCSLPRDLHQFAHQSISDWKNVYAPECSMCSVKDRCSGLFAWHERGWKPAPVKAIREEAP